MTADIKAFLLEKLGKYADIPDEEMDMIIAKLRSKYIAKHDFFLQAGDSTSSLAFIYSGFFRVYCIDSSGNEKTLSFRRNGQFLSGYSPFLEKKEIWYSIQALEDAEIGYINFADYKKLEGGHPCWNELIKNYVTKLFIEKEQRERSLLLDDATTRYLRFLQDYPGYEERIPQYHIASYLGITAVSLSRIRAAIKKSGPPALE
ncbi:Crp/Fnr family transcriptional regulator [Sediminispirochaeta smaragdinae]|uniref:Transcriptional regulator, Crp/Fnr family n=1 Tax=Sediminispirochaeta smaragdinae (strain DSM 11293 / JCM 15392 / SEBR 4228) TaxID=573413 RepID=E1RBY0_SEDSS|nr:Crp/Fnr family transcriptional regulator [Sediminispirochaeta smaragdinae]ADK79860.1 putative transcriptional regulator, Crp/Fnr family [Sediminispirochaeta smaragdinae DSM 11293]